MGNYDCDCRTGTCCAECCTTCKDIENNIEADNTYINGADYAPALIRMRQFFLGLSQIVLVPGHSWWTDVTASPHTTT